MGIEPEATNKSMIELPMVRKAYLTERAFGEIVRKHLEHAGPEVPLHITAYRPAHRYAEPSTPVAFLEYACRAAREAGVLFPYLGNVRGTILKTPAAPNAASCSSSARASSWSAT